MTRPRLKKTAIIATAILGAVVVLALVVPAVIDWSRYKDAILARVEPALGRKVDIAGDLNVRLLPSLAITAETVRIANLPGFEPPAMVTVDAVRLKLSLLDLLSGRIAIDPLVLERPVVILQRRPDGRANWDFQPAGAPPPAAAPEPAGPARQGEGREVRLEGVSIHDGVVVYQRDGGEPLRAEAIDARIDMASLSGPFAANGTLRLNGSEMSVEAGLARRAADGRAPLTLTLRLPSLGAGLHLAGSVGDGPSLSGRIQLTAESLRRLADGLPSAALTADGTLSVNRDEAALHDVAMTVGEARATGSAVAALGASPVQVDAAMKVTGLDLDRLMDSRVGHAASPGPSGRREAAPPPGTAAKAAAPEFALPRGVSAHLTLEADQVIWRGGQVRQVAAEAMLEDGRLSVSRAAARLPGDTAVSVTGMLGAEGGAPAFDGRVKASSDSLRVLLGWLGVAAGDIPDTRLRHFALDGAVTAAGERISVAGLDARLDSTRIRGAATVRLGARPAFGLDLAADSVDLDAYRQAPPAKPAQPHAGAVTAAPPASSAAPPPTAPSPLAALAGFDANVRLRLERLVMNEVPAGGLSFDATLQDGRLTVREAVVGDLAGAAARASGVVEDLAASPRLRGVAWQVKAAQPARLFRFLGMSPPIAPERLTGLTLAGSLEGDWTALALDARLSAAGLEATAKGSLGSPLEAPRWDLGVTARHASTAQLLRLFSEGYHPRGGLGAFALSARVAGDPRTVEVSDIKVSAGDAALTGHARATLAGHPAITAELAAGAVDLDPFMPAHRSGAVVPLPGGLRGPGGTVPLPMAAPIPAAEGLPGPWSRQPLGLESLRAFDAQVGLTARSVVWQGWTLDGPAARLSVRGGTAALDSLTGGMMGGTLSASARLAAAGMTGTVSIAGASLKDARLGGGGVQVTRGVLDAEAGWQAAGRSSWEMVQSLAGTGRLAVRDGLITGFDLPAVNQRLQHIETLGSLLGLAQAGLTGGSTGFSSLTGTFKAERGLVASRDLKLDAQGGSATGEMVLNLPQWTQDTRLAFRLAESSAPPLGLRLEGPLDQPRKIVDVNELQRWLAERGLGRALSGKGGTRGLIDSLTGRKSGDQPAEAQPEQKPRDMLKGLLRGLVR